MEDQMKFSGSELGPEWVIEIISVRNSPSEISYFVSKCILIKFDESYHRFFSFLFICSMSDLCTLSNP